MSQEYRTLLSGLPDYVKLPESLIEHLSLPPYQDAEVNYLQPTIEDIREDPLPKNQYTRGLDNLRLPARINGPLVPYPTEIMQYITDEFKGNRDIIHGHHLQDLDEMKKLYHKLIIKLPILDRPLSFDINLAKRLAEKEFSTKTDLINMATNSFAIRATTAEFSLITKECWENEIRPTKSSPQLSFLLSVHRLRTFIARSNRMDIISDFEIENDIYDAKFLIFDSATYLYYANNNDFSYFLIMTPEHFMIYHSGIQEWFCGPSIYFDYIFTLADIINNLTVIKSLPEYEWLIPYADILIGLSSSNYDHNTTVEFMKNTEGLLLNFSDYDEEYAMNWQPIMDILVDMWKLDKTMTGVDYPFDELVESLGNSKIRTSKITPLTKIISLKHNLTRTQCQELSSLHKFVYYSEINLQKGLEKFLKRVHNTRPMSDDSIKNLTRLAKKLFFISYSRKHKSIPNIMGENDKCIYLSINGLKNKQRDIENLPLNWWDDIEIRNCMDNTATDDALEFAKDKGALKEDIFFGPGDSRKELLQVIEKKSYKLKYFFAEGPYTPKKRRIVRRRAQKNAFKTKHQVRLSPKEREQKQEGRFFGTGELSNKHALSVVALKMKKVLSYFDEQLMTPQDKKRKELLHKAAQKLTKKDTYSLLLDIEGHNQSMQYRNTHELASFCGGLFGEKYWESLPHYFSHIDVYYYDEFLDDCIHSIGQLGGIEGWLNGFWTLHTTLMMKLMRYMTDIEIPQIMVYSDDVNALVNIPQATGEQVQSIFNKISKHCIKFGMITKMAQTNLSKHRVTMLRQHYADGIRADSTLKKLISTSGANNPVLHSESVEIDGICSSVSSAVELTNHSLACCYLKNYKIGLILSRLPHMILKFPQESGPLSMKGLPVKLSSLLYQIKDDRTELLGKRFNECVNQVRNDIASYLNMNRGMINENDIHGLMKSVYGLTVNQYKFIDQPDRLLYLQIYDDFIQDLLFFWTYLPAALGGLGGILQINLILSGHSSGMAKELHYLKEWIVNYSSNPDYFLNYLTISLGIDMTNENNIKETKAISTYWPSDIIITTATTSINQAIRSMVAKRTRNDTVLKLLELNNEIPDIQAELIEIFRDNFHPRIAQFYSENTSGHFIDLLLNKVETSSGLLRYVRSLSRLRNSLTSRLIQNIRLSAKERTTIFGPIYRDTDMIEYMINRRSIVYKDIKFIECDEPLYDDKLEETFDINALITVRRHSPMHYDDGYRVYDTPDMGNEINYKGDWLDNERMLGNKEELLAAKLVAVTKWLITKYYQISVKAEDILKLDCYKAAELALSTLTGQTMSQLWNNSPNETGGEVLHRVPNVRFNNTTYIRSELNLLLEYTADLNQRVINALNLVDSNINFDYIRLRLTLLMAMRSKSRNKSRLLTRWKLTKLNTIMDVQFVKPKETKYMVTKVFTAYGLYRGHVFSELRFRYMSTRYLNVENLDEMAIMPNLDETNAGEQTVHDLILELVYSYATALDKEYMRIMSDRIEIDSWKPLMGKLAVLRPEYKNLNENEQIEQLRSLMIESFSKSRKISIINKSDTTKLSLQKQCVEYLFEEHPRDLELSEISKSILSTRSANISGLNYKHKIKHFKRKLDNYNSKKKKLAISLILEYLIYYQFKVLYLEGRCHFNWKLSLTLLRDHGMNERLISLINPELHLYLDIIGYEYIETLYRSDFSDIENILADISDNNVLSDVIIPSKLPNLKPITNLTGNEYIDTQRIECEYDKEWIPESAMANFNDLKPLLKYARNCSEIGASPYVFMSITGSDSFVSQYSLFKMLLRYNMIDNKTKILDLTAGRGDMIYSARELGLTMKSYSLRDTFTSVYHHPAVDFTRDYDIFDTNTLKFIRDYQWIHIDVSFTGSEKNNILDLILFMEENNLSYSVRLNSVELSGYVKERLEGLPTYTHHISYPSNSTMKPYQIYLIGTPAEEIEIESSLNIKQTVAFRSIALGYTPLLSFHNSVQRLYDWSINSATIYPGDIDNITTIAMAVSEKYYYQEQSYYLKRLMTVDEFDSKIYFRIECFPEFDRQKLRLLSTRGTSITHPVYDTSTSDDFGNISQNSRFFHINHLIMLQGNNISKVEIEFNKLNYELAKYLRGHHPLQSVRNICETYIKCQELFPGMITSDSSTLDLLYSTISDQVDNRDTRNQKEYQDAIGWLVVSASFDDYRYAIYQLRIMMGNAIMKSSSLNRIYKTYRLLSCCYDHILEIVQRGYIPLEWINSIKNKLISRENKKIKSIYGSDDNSNSLNLAEFHDIKIEIDFDQLIKSITESVLDTTNQTYDDTNGFIIPNSDQFLSGQFNVDILDNIDRYLETHADLVPDELGRYMIDDAMPDDPDLM